MPEGCHARPGRGPSPRVRRDSVLVCGEGFLVDAMGAVTDFPEADLRRERVQARRVSCACERFPAGSTPGAALVPREAPATVALVRPEQYAGPPAAREPARLRPGSVTLLRSRLPARGRCVGPSHRRRCRRGPRPAGRAARGAEDHPDRGPDPVRVSADTGLHRPLPLLDTTQRTMYVTPVLLAAALFTAPAVLHRTLFQRGAKPEGVMRLFTARGGGYERLDAGPHWLRTARRRRGARPRRGRDMAAFFGSRCAGRSASLPSIFVRRLSVGAFRAVSTQRGDGPGRSWPQTGGVLGLVAGLLQVSGDLVGPVVPMRSPVAGGPADAVR